MWYPYFFIAFDTYFCCTVNARYCNVNNKVPPSGCILPTLRVLRFRFSSSWIKLPLNTIAITSITWITPFLWNCLTWIPQLHSLILLSFRNFILLHYMKLETFILQWLCFLVLSQTGTWYYCYHTNNITYPYGKQETNILLISSL